MNLLFKNVPVPVLLPGIVNELKRKAVAQLLFSCHFFVQNSGTV
jgi:hypothetical protein